ncbi:sensor domain-containing protein [Cohnella caldifontis]|uniref:sensor domain-containing protein n=1 Tax=Cohnella caldifontis TaxID=3027471 RepID=UPI0023ED7CDE|nr:EAL domain-containing protein [Cohnella sp. YIM B05605]
MLNTIQELADIYRPMFEYNPDACYAIDPEGRFVLVNQAATDLCGYSQEEMLAMSFVSVLHEQQRDRVIDRFHQALRGSRESFETVLKHPDGRLIHVLVTAAPIVVEGKVHGIIGISKNVTEKNVLAEELSASRTQLHYIVNHLDIFYWSFDVKENRFRSVSPSCEKLFGVSAQQLVSSREAWKRMFHPDDLPRLEQDHRELGGRPLRAEYRIIRSDGEIRWVDYNAIPVYDGSGELIRLEGLVTDIHERKQIEERLERQAFHDALTGLPNRRRFMDKLEETIFRAKRENRKTAILYLDLDRFKFINDSLGHDVGDQLLRMIARRLEELLGPRGVVSRLGGDEFSILTEPVGEFQWVRALAKEVLAAIQQPVKLYHMEYTVTTSIGISVCPDFGTDAATLLKQADQAMYLAKENGKNNFQFFNLELDARLARKTFLEQSMRQAVKSDELLLHYQPIFDAETGRLHGFEALLRWEHPTLGPVSPAEMIPIAEETGLIVPIGEQVLRMACLQMKAWQDKGYPEIGISVNIAAQQLNEHFIPLVRSVLDETGLPVSSLTLELTESTAMQQVSDTLSKIEQLRVLGVKLSIDDFGTGYSSLSYLKKFQIHALKIDQSFVRDIDKDEGQEAIIKAVVAIADSLRIGVVAEGVETEEQIRFLRRLGCRLVQGYYFSKPLPAAQIERMYFRDKAAR